MEVPASSPAAQPNALGRAVLRRWPVALLITLVAVGAATGAALSRGSTYESTAKLLLLPLPQYDQTFFGTGLLRDAGDPKLTAATAAEVLHSRGIAGVVARRIGRGATAGSVLDAVALRPAGETNVLRVVAQADTPKRATRLADAFADSVDVARWRVISSQLARRIATLRAARAAATRTSAGSITDQLQALETARAAGTDPTVEVAQHASPAVAPSRTSVAAVLILALIGGAGIGALAAIGADRIGGRIRDEDDALGIYSLPVWARVPTAPRRLRGGGPISPSGMDGRSRRAFRALAEHVTRWAPEGGAIVVVSASEADGRTTAAANLTAALAESGRRAAIVRIGRQSGGGILEADLEASGVAVVADTDEQRPFVDVLEEARQRAEIVVIDGPSVRRGEDLVGATAVADVVLVVRVGHTPRQQMQQARDVLESIDARPAGLLLIGTGRSDTRHRAPEPSARPALDKRTSPPPRSGIATRDPGDLPV